MSERKAISSITEINNSVCRRCVTSKMVNNALQWVLEVFFGGEIY